MNGKTFWQTYKIGMRLFGHMKNICLLLNLGCFVIVACSSPSGKQVYGIGDQVNVGYDMTMTLSSTKFHDNILEASFTVENNGVEDQTFNLWMSLQASDSNGTPFAQLIPCGTNMDGILVHGERSTGTICWVIENAEIVKIHYINFLFESDIVWEVDV